MRTNAWLEVHHPCEADRVLEALQQAAPDSVELHRNDGELGSLGIPLFTTIAVSFLEKLPVATALERCNQLAAAAGVHTKVAQAV